MQTKLTRNSARPVFGRAKHRARTAGLIACIAGGAVSLTTAASAQIAFPPPGSRTFIQLYEIDSGQSVCDLLCTIVSSPSAPLELPQTHFTRNNDLTFIDAGGSVTADAMHALITTNHPGTEFDLAMDDTYTVQGTAVGSFPITVTFEAKGVANSGGNGPFDVFLAGFDMRMGTFLIDPAATPIPEVSPFDSTTRVDQFFSIVQSTPFSVPVDFTISYTRMVSVGDVFDVGYELSPSPVVGQFDFSHTAAISWDLPKGVSLTSALGGKFGGVPEPGAWAMILLGLGVVGASARRIRAAVAPPPSPAA
jgi:hypothetical protein